MRAKKQEERIKAYLNKYGSVNALQAWKDCGVYRLSDVIYKLRRTFCNIKTETADCTNQFGEPVRVARYVLTD